VSGKGAARSKARLGGTWGAEEPFAGVHCSSPHSYLFYRHIAIVAKGLLSWVAPEADSPSSRPWLNNPEPVAAAAAASAAGCGWAVLY